MTAKLTLFNPHSVEDQAYVLASHLPTGEIWRKAFDPTSVFGKLIVSLSLEFYRFDVLKRLTQTEMDIETADSLLIEWEKSVGIPDDCFTTTVSTSERRKQVEQKFSKFGGVQTADDLVRVAAVFGLMIEVYPGIAIGGFPLVFPLPFFDSRKSAVHTIMVKLIGVSTSVGFPLSFPIPFSSGGTNFLRCIFEKLIPVNTQLIFYS